MHFLEVQNLTYDYTVAGDKKYHAINNISFSLEKGEILGIIGHTGSGKSTLVSHLNGLLRANSGKVLIDGKDIWENPKEIYKIRGRVGLVFQYPEYQLFEETVFEDIAFGPKNLKLDPVEINERVMDAAQLLGVSSNLFSKSPFDLSGGQKRRVAIAGIVAMQPELIVFDEPTAGLDPKGRTDIFKAIDGYRREKNASVIIVSHSMEDMAAICDKILVLNQGSVFDYGKTEDIFSKSEELKSIGLNIPIISQVMLKFKEKSGLDIDNAITVNEAVKILLPILKKGENYND